MNVTPRTSSPAPKRLARISARQVMTDFEVFSLRAAHLQCGSTNRSVRQGAQHAEAAIATERSLFERSHARDPFRAFEYLADILREKMNALAMALVVFECLGVEIPVVGRIVAIDVLSFKQIRRYAEIHKMVNDAIDDVGGTAQQLREFFPVCRVLKRTDLKSDSHRRSASNGQA